MAKRVGITHDEEERKEHWEREYPNLYGWKRVAKGLTYEEAQEIEEEYIKKGFKGGLGGKKKYGVKYCVYIFYY